MTVSLLLSCRLTLEWPPRLILSGQQRSLLIMRHAQIPRSLHQQRSSTALTFLTYILISLIALLPRILKLDQFITVDEISFWIPRSNIFLDALRSGDALATAISTHPGVTTMWSGALGLLLRQWLTTAGIFSGFTEPGAIALMRLPLVLGHTLGIVVGYALLRRMLSPLTAFLAALLWAADPFAIAYSRVLHVDGPLMTWSTVALLAACCYWHGSGRPTPLLLSGIAAGLALLSKSPALLLPPLIAMIALVAYRWPLQNGVHPLSSFRSIVLRPMLLWSGAVLITTLLLWPALWLGPLKIYEQIRIGVMVEGGSPHMLGNFFLGRADDAPGLLFYPVALALRLTPITLIGLLLVPLVWRDIPGVTRRDLAVLAAFVILFTLAMSFFPKKFNRYLVPIFPALDILAAVGIAGLARLLASSMKQRVLMPAFVSIIIMLAILNVAWWHPYTMVAFNQLLGGAQRGERTFTVGWGEGYELVAAWLNQQPDITGVRVVSRRPQVMNPYLRQGAQSVTPDEGSLPAKTGYLVVYIEQVQGGPPSPPFSNFYQHAIPVHIVSIKDVTYAWIYQVPPPLEQERSATFDGSLHLLGIRSSSTPAPGQLLQLQLVWTLDQPADRQLIFFAHVLGPDGQRISQVDVPLPVSEWQPGRYMATDLVIPLSADQQPGSYRVLLGVYDAITSQRLSLVSPYTVDPALDGPDVLLLLVQGAQ